MSEEMERWMADYDAMEAGVLPVIVEEGCICPSCATSGCSLCSRAGCTLHWNDTTLYPARRSPRSPR